LIVLDASAFVCILLNSPPAKAHALGARLLAEDIHVPHLVDIEVTHTLRRHVLTGVLSVTDASTALSDFQQYPVTRHPHYPLLNRIWQLRTNLTAYDATYVALAELLGTSLLTLDARIARAGISTAIEVF
jgi:predicted nucleic acid-binding protein